MRRLFAYLAEEHGAPQLGKYVPKVTPPAPRATTVTSEERERLLAYAPLWLRCWLLLCSDLAMRNATAARICPNDYNAEKGELTFRTKFGTRQTLPVTAELATIFRLVPKDSDTSKPYTVLLHPLGRVCPKYPSMAFYQLRLKLGIKRQITAHDLRRTTATTVYNQTRDLRTVQAVLGHKQLATTLYYLDHRNTPVPLSVLELAKLNPTTEGVQ